MVIVYSKTKKCSSCSKKWRSSQQRKRTWSNGYVYFECGNRPRPEHIVKAEKILGRALDATRKECVHHVNMRKDDNRNSNLLICDNKYHMWLHLQYARLFAERNFDYVSSS